VGCTCASGAGELELFRVGPVAAAVAVRRGGMACAAKTVRQPPEARPWRRMSSQAAWAWMMLTGNFRPSSLSADTNCPS
jgi:hypothetical protein